jgi:hypothetical protein
MGLACMVEERVRVKKYHISFAGDMEGWEGKMAGRNW